MSVADALASQSKVTLDRKVKGQVRILTIDIETKPMTVYSWGLFKQNHSIGQIVEDGGIICFAAKWFGEREVIFHSVRDGYENMIRAAWDLLTEADVVVHYNGDSFDVKHLHEAFQDLKLGPPAPFKSVDLIKTNRNRFAFPSRKLDYLAGRAGVGHKVKHQGFDLWIDCMADDDAAWAMMEKYNRGDVTLTEKVYLQLLPWITGGPHFGMLTGQTRACPYCGSDRLNKTGRRVNAFVQSYSLLRCSNCLGWVREVFKRNEPNFTRAVK